MAELTALNLQAIQLTEAEPPKPTRAIGGEDFIFFNEQLASLAAAGICLDEGLRQLAADVESPRLRRVIQGVADEVQQGQPLDKAVAAHEVQGGRALGPDDRGRVALELDRDVEIGERGRQQRRGAHVELALHQPVEQVDDRHRAALRGDAASGFEPQQPAADDRGVLRAARCRRSARDTPAKSIGSSTFP